ncbi:kinase-like protein [Heliocybe sulcata]|uniref:Kinase-like protein n=1 Tax=Heliocybe sulcata TaxID=5364 RepID=A0A5C3N505_9AGAM|nr:kinase-like protein [Heliocybe sulcata]
MARSTYIPQDASPAPSRATLDTLQGQPVLYQNYDIQEEIGQGRSSIVYVSVCNRGRLRNRKVALKKIIHSKSNQTDLIRKDNAEAAILHQSLHHPSIVALFSVFPAPSATYHILELCSQGTLRDYLFRLPHRNNSSTLTDNQLRGIVKSLADALVYLRKELVLHRNITPSSIFITNDFRIKLGDFSLAVRLPNPKATVSTICGSPNYVSPEIIANTPYSFPSDAWSVGCVISTCITGYPPFEAISVAETHTRVSRAKYDIPPASSLHAKHLISELLQTDPKRRMKAENIQKHPFLDPSLPTDPLGPHSSVPRSKRSSDRPLRDVLKVHTDTENTPKPPHDNHKSEPDKENKRPFSHAAKPSIAPRRPFMNTANTLGGPSEPKRTLDPRRVLSEEIKRAIKDKPRFPQIQHGRRVFSAPQDRPTTASSAGHGGLVPRPRAGSVGSASGLTEDTGSSLARDKVVDGPNENRANTPQDEWDNFALLQPPRHAEPDTNLPYRRASVPWLSPPLPSLPSAPDVASPPPAARGLAPTGAARPIAFTTALLQPQTHKLPSGQLTILPQTHSLMIDFRERERRKGRRGDRVLVVSADGQMIEVYEAPHLSTPCCLVEPVARYALRELPGEYWRLYGDAGRVVGEVKRRTPKMTMHLPAARCTLMANEPRGDIELVFRDAYSRARGKPGDEEAVAMRVRLSREKQALEIARYGSAGEWAKRVWRVDAEEELAVAGLDDAERKAVEGLRRFLRVCEAAEGVEAEVE